MQNVSLAEWVVSVDTIPDKVRTAAVHVVADAVAAAIAGHSYSGSEAARKAGLNLWGNGECSIWFTSQSGSLSAAAFSNAMAACILDLDDGHRAAAGHPGAAIVPAVLAAAEAWGVSGERTLTAIAIGYEVGVRIAAARDLRAVDTLISGRWCGQGVAAALGWLKGVSALQISEAMAVAGAIAPYMVVAEYTEVGNHTKEAIPFSVANGVMAVQLAEYGFKGPLDILDNEAFDPDVLKQGSADSWYIETTYFKPYGCCRWIHAPIDAVLALRDQLDWSSVEEIEVETFERTLSLNNQIHPNDVQAAQYSTPFCIAAVALNGAACLQPMSADILQDARISALAEKVRLVVAPELDAMFPAAVPGKVRVRSGTSTVEKEVLVPKGEPGNPMDWDELIAKLNSLALPQIGVTESRSLETALAVLRDHSDLEPLLGQLRKKL